MTTTTELKTPTLARRMACWVYEGMLLFGVVFVAGCAFFGVGALFGTSNPSSQLIDRNYPLQGFVFVVIGIYFVWFWSKGQTLAMKTWGITVLDLSGKPVTQSRALMRYVLSWLWFMPALVLIAGFKFSGTESSVALIGWVAIWATLSRFHPTNQFLHDAMSSTQLAFKPNVAR